MKPQLLGKLKKGLIFILSAPAGTGKTTLINLLTAEFPCVRQSISYTTRAPRENEVHGVHYYFVSREEFEKKIDEHAFLEYVLLYGDYYGTCARRVAEHQSQGCHVVLVIDTQGALQLMGKVEATYIFIAPPSLADLRERLIARKSETAESLQHRLAIADKEIQSSCFYDYRIINDDLQTAYQVLRTIFIAEEHRVGLAPECL